MKILVINGPNINMLSQTIPLEQLYEERKDAYSYWSDFFINNNEERD